MARKLRHRIMSQAAINIVNRDDANGGGRDWDHKTIQELCRRPTVAVASKTQHSLEIELGRQYAKSKGLPVVPFRWFNEDRFAFAIGTPAVREDGRSGEGLLVIPGGPNSLATEVLGQPGVPNGEHLAEGARLRFQPKPGHENSCAERADFQARLLREARKVGQPVLGICGGAWHIAASFGGNTVTSSEFEARHTSAMPSLIPIPQQEGNPAIGVAHGVVMQHPIHVESGSLLANAMNLSDTDLDINVNSVHWAEVLSTHGQYGEISGIAGSDPISNRPASELLKVSARVRSAVPEEATIEGFESRHGAPILAVQYHPEALAGKPTLPAGAAATSTFDDGDYAVERARAESLFRYMAAAGDAFAARRRMTREFDARVADGTLSNGDAGNFPLPSQL